MGGCLATRVPLEKSTGAPPAPLEYVQTVKQLLVRVGLKSHSRLHRSCEPVLTSVHFCGLGDPVIILFASTNQLKIYSPPHFFLDGRLCSAI